MKTRITPSRLLTFLLLFVLTLGIGCGTGGGSLTGEASQATVSSSGANNKVPWIGTMQFGTPLFDYPSAIATDFTGSVYVSGGSSGDIDNCGCMSRMDGIVVKYGSSGVLEWSLEIEEDAWIFSRAIASPPHRKLVYVTGETDADLTGTGSSPGRLDIFLYRIDSKGNRVLLAQEGTPEDDYPRAAAADSKENVYVAGATFGSLDGKPSAGNRDAFVMKWDSKGKRVWAVQFGSADIDMASGLTLDAAGYLYVAGHTFGALGGEVNQGGSDVFLAKVSPGGILEWIKMLGTPLSDTATSIAMDAAGNVFVAGTTGGRLGGMINSGSTDAFVAKFTPDGILVWIKLIGTTKEEYGYAVATDSAGFAYIAGQTSGSLGGTSSGNRDAFVACLAGDTGRTAWIRQIGTDRDDCALAIAVDGNGDLFVAGSTLGRMDGNTNFGSCDLFVCKLDRYGNEY